MFDMNYMNVRIGNILKNDIKQNNKYGYCIQNQNLYIIAIFFYVICRYRITFAFIEKGDIDA